MKCCKNCIYDNNHICTVYPYSSGASELPIDIEETYFCKEYAEKTKTVLKESDSNGK